jgi:hypothetical protein
LGEWQTLQQNQAAIKCILTAGTRHGIPPASIDLQTPAPPAAEALEQNDIPRAMSAFREAFLRDGYYQPVRANLMRMKPPLDAVNAVTREVEPNDYYLLANVISLDPGKYRLTGRPLKAVPLQPSQYGTLWLDGSTAFKPSIRSTALSSTL